MKSSFYRRFRLPIFLLFVVIAVVATWGSEMAMKTNSNRVRDWLPQDFPETQDLLWYVDTFGGGDLLMISWDDCTIDDPRIAELAELLRQPAEVEGRGKLDMFRDVLTPREVLQTMGDSFLTHPNATAREADTKAMNLMEGWLAGPEREDGQPRTGAIVVEMTVAGFQNIHAAIEHIRDSADRVEGLSREQLHLAGPTMDSVAIDETSAAAMDEMLLFCVIVSVVVMFLCFRSFLLTLFVMAAAFVNQQLALGLVYFTGSTMDSIMLMVPSLVYVLTVSAGVHLVNYYRDTVHEKGLAGAPARMVRLGWAPCILASATTALGLLSLLISFLIPIQKFGGYGALGLMCGTVVLFMILPSLLEQFPLRRWSREKAKPDSLSDESTVWNRVEQWTTRLRYPIILSSLVLLVASVWGVGKIQATAKLHDMFRPKARILQDYAWLEEHIGPLVPIDVVLRTPRVVEQTDGEGYSFPMLDRMRLIEEVERSVSQLDDIDDVFSAVDLTPPLPAPHESGKKAGINRILLAHRPDLIDADLLRETADQDLWRIRVRVKASDRPDFAALYDRLRDNVNATLATSPNNATLDATAVFVGGIPLVQKAQVQLLDDLRASFLLAFGLIAVAMVVLLFTAEIRSTLEDDVKEGFDRVKQVLGTFVRCALAGMLCMIPNVLPSVLVFGVMGFTDVKIEVGSMMTATAAMGIAVDDTLHFVTWFRRGLAAGQTRREAVHTAYSRCGTAMVQTTLICGLGLAAFGFSPFGPISRFGILMFSMLFTAILGDLIVLPALLISPLGHIFEHHRRPKQAVPTGQVEARA